MECIVLSASEERRTALQWQTENLGADWRCTPVWQASQAISRLRERYAGLVIASPGAETQALMSILTARPLLAPPYVLGDGFSAQDGELPPLEALPGRLRTWKCDGHLPSLCEGQLPAAETLAVGLLRALGVSPRLRAWDFLPGMVAMTAVHPPMLTDLQHGLYPLTGRRCGMTACAVERSLRLCVESTWSRGSLTALERFFGSSVDPDKGKPTNREFLCRLQERVTLSANRLRR